jgi:hypothetical protein
MGQSEVVPTGFSLSLQPYESREAHVTIEMFRRLRNCDLDLVGSHSSQFRAHDLLSQPLPATALQELITKPVFEFIMESMNDDRLPQRSVN